MAFLKAWLSASVLLISREKISLPARAVKGVSCPRAWAIPAFTEKHMGWGSPSMSGRWWNVVLLNRTHSDSSLSSAWLASNQHCSSSYVAIFNHLQNDSCCSARSQLADHPLRHLGRNNIHDTWRSAPLSRAVNAFSLLRHPNQRRKSQKHIIPFMLFQREMMMMITCLGCRASSKPRPRMCEWAPKQTFKTTILTTF